MKNYAELTPFLALFDASHRHSYELLEASWTSGGRDSLAMASQQQVSYDCPFPAFVYATEHPERYSLTHYRDMYRHLRRRGYLSLAAGMLNRVASVTGKRSDEDAAAQFREQHQSAGEAVERPESAQVDAAPGRAGTVLILAYELDEAIPLALDLADEGFAAEIMHLTDRPTKPRWHESVRIHGSSVRGGDDSPAVQSRKFATAIEEALALARPALIHAALEPAHAAVVSRVARMEGVACVWDYSPDENWRARFEAKQEGAVICPIHLPESLAPTSAEIECAVHASATWTRTKHAAERLRRVVGDGPRVELHPFFQSLRAGCPEESVTLFVEANNAPVLELIDALAPVLEPRSHLAGDKVTLIGAGQEKGVRVARGLPKNVTVEVAASWELLTDSKIIGNSAAIFPRYPSGPQLHQQTNRVARARALGLPVVLAADDTVGPYLQPGESLRYYNPNQSDSLVQQLKRIIDQKVLRYDGTASLGRSLLRHYSKLGVTSRVAPRKTRVSDSRDFEISKTELHLWTEWVRDNYSPRGAEWFSVRGQTASQVLEEGWRFAEFPPVKIGTNTNWLGEAQSDRSWGFHLHAWEFMDPVIQEFRKSGQTELLRWCLEVATGWYRQMRGVQSHQTMAWYDMALALRSSRLAGLIHLAVSEGMEAGLKELFSLALIHQDAHAADESFNPGNNHGFYAALGQSILARELRALPGMQGLLVQGTDRLRQVVTRQFLADGGHAEHSPDYHRMLLESFRKAIEQRVITDPVVTARIQRASYVLGWLVQPQGTLLQFGDSPATPMVRPDAFSLDPQAQFVLTDGQEGTPDDSELLSLPETGYAVVRTPQPKKEGDLKRSSYLALMAAFHSRAHKQCDDLSLVWTHKGTEILVDGGRYGYGDQLPTNSPLRKMGFYYADPMRQFVESVWAHNTASVDSNNPDRRRPPYGSGLVDAVTKDGAFYLVAEVPHVGWTHHREVYFSPESVLRITDTFDATDSDPHSYSVHFNINGDLTVKEMPDKQLDIYLGEKRLARLEPEVSAAALTIQRAAHDPLRGWRSVTDRHSVPTWFVACTGSFRGHHKHTSTFVLQ